MVVRSTRPRAETLTSGDTLCKLIFLTTPIYHKLKPRPMLLDFVEADNDDAFVGVSISD